MSAHIKCNCGRKRGDHSDLVVRMRHHNRSAFNGYRTNNFRISRFKHLSKEDV